ncbi:MAG: ATP-binding protein, partial [Muribaculaceae bacterium]|nr:ATP-binding protein [Muribaculaceae bacterium]
MNTVILPPNGSGTPSAPRLKGRQRLFTLLGGNGSGKSLFMNEIFRLNQPDAYPVSAVAGGMPARMQGSLTSMIETLASEEEQERMMTLKQIWEEIFPGNIIEIEGGKPQVRNRSGKDSVSIRRLSRGEKAGLYYIA